jgi:hypothetical protein
MFWKFCLKVNHLQLLWFLSELCLTIQPCLKFSHLSTWFSWNVVWTVSCWRETHFGTSFLCQQYQHGYVALEHLLIAYLMMMLVSQNIYTQVVGWLWHWKGCCYGITLTFAWRDWGKTNTSVRRVGVLISAKLLAAFIREICCMM